MVGDITYTGNKGHNTVGLVLASEICILQSGLIQYLLVLDLNPYRNIVSHFSNFQFLIQPQLNHSETKLDLNKAIFEAQCYSTYL